MLIILDWFSREGSQQFLDYILSLFCMEDKATFKISKKNKPKSKKQNIFCN